MSDGGRDSGKDNQTASTSSRKSQKEQQHHQQSSFGDEFGWAVSRIAVAQVCESTGFLSAHRSALDALVVVAIRYIYYLGRSANSNANLAGRSCCDLFDVIQGLEFMGSSQGFFSASDPHHCLMSSGVIREISQFVSMGKEVLFARSIPRWPVARVSKATLSLNQGEEKPGGKHIPEWLPKFPDPCTYMLKPVQNERATCSKANAAEQEIQRRKAESSRLRLQHRFAWNTEGGSSQINYSDTGKGKQVMGTNPFLAPPLPYRDKEVSEIAVQSDPFSCKGISVFETFAPAVEAAKVSSLVSEPCDKRILPSKRPVVNFKIGSEKKTIAASLAFDTSNLKSDKWSLRDEERGDEMDDKKRRAEMILKEAMENPYDL